jgi:hypothetical protein
MESINNEVNNVIFDRERRSGSGKGLAKNMPTAMTYAAFR